eukprot:TRINITY_DN110099_c0_g1_i1.p1 TRINITY_DN110099_c0_g1~~TRINITY_DN110099_c0_g1_i1.p1  ORF type:complete len:289 (+),score=43.61 TRINITY_DN110099_c0_g1_i1:100-966(+)
MRLLACVQIVLAVETARGLQNEDDIGTRASLTQLEGCRSQARQASESHVLLQRSIALSSDSPKRTSIRKARNLWNEYDIGTRTALIQQGGQWSQAHQASESQLCDMFRAAARDLVQRSKPDFTGWTSSGSPVLRVPYRIGPAGNKGLGLFAVSNILKGQAIYDGGPLAATMKYWLVLPQNSFHLIHKVAAGFSKDVVTKLMDWCEHDFSTDRGLICEMGDEHYINSDTHPNIEPCDVGYCALRDIEPGEELLENYEDEGLDDRQSMTLIQSIIDSAESAVPGVCGEAP